MIQPSPDEGYGPSDMFASEDAYASSPDQAVAELIQLIDTNHAAITDNRYWQYEGNDAGDTEVYNGQTITIQGGGQRRNKRLRVPLPATVDLLDRAENFLCNVLWNASFDETTIARRSMTGAIHSDSATSGLVSTKMIDYGIENRA